jgi:microsomal dipeptidase-like Zn-dependent dipeptidase
MKYFDFHAHTILKQCFSDNPNIDTTVSRRDVDGIPRTCTDLPNIIESQIHQSQLAEFDEEVVIGVVLYGMESFLAQEVLKLRHHLRAGSQHKLSGTLLTDIFERVVLPFTDFTIGRTLNNYLNAPQSFNVLRRTSFDQPLPKNKVNLFFVIEGCHTLVDTSNGRDIVNNPFPPAEILSNLDGLLSKVPVIAVNPVHMQQSNLANHAFAIQLTNVQHFIPRGNGLTNDGRTVIQGLFDRGICVDTKHMSYKSRLDLRNDIDAGRFSNVQPLVCTHAGFTGIPFRQWAGFIARKSGEMQAVHVEVAKTMQVHNLPGRPGAPSFNMTTINLFDEEIVWIVRHGGMIGLSLDRRIIGYVGKHDDHPTGHNPDSPFIVDKEYISLQEWTALEIPDVAIGKSVNEDDCMTMTELEESAEGSIPSRDEFFFDHVLLQLKHYLQVCINADIALEVACRHIGIGSDFDGLINPFINMSTVKDMHDLKRYIRMNFRFFLESLEDSKLWFGQLDINSFVEDLFYNNGFNFVKSRLVR